MFEGQSVVPLRPMQVIEVLLQSVPGAWGYSWATLPGVLWIWWTGPPQWGLGNWPTAYHHRKAVRKSKMWLRMGKLQ